MKQKKSNDTIYDTTLGIRKSDKHSGIYKIENKLNGKVYIGQSVRVFFRINTHRTNLRRGVHGNSHLQLSCNKYGEDAFTFEVIEFCSEDELNEKEAKWIIHYNSTNKHYGYNNMIPDPTEKKFRHSEKTKKQLSKRSKYSKEELISFLQEFFYMEGRIFTCADEKNKLFNNYPRRCLYDTAFGSFANAIKEADLELFDSKANNRKRDHYTEEIILNSFNRFIEKNNRFPNTVDLKNKNINDLPSTEAILSVFGGMEELRKRIGYTKEMQKEEEKLKSLALMKTLYDSGVHITYQSLNESKLTKSPNYYITHFDSIDNAINLAGIDVTENRSKKITHHK